MIQRGDSLKGLAMRSFGVATGIPSRMPVSSISTTTTPAIATTMSAFADPRKKCLDDGQAHGRKTLGRESPGTKAPKARLNAKPKTAAMPTGVAVECGRRITLDSANLVLANPNPKSLQRGFVSGKYRTEMDGLYKRCCRCNDYWPADSEFFYTDKNGADGLFGFCKACYLEKRYPNGRRIQVELKAA